jgi:hypothetical protein
VLTKPLIKCNADPACLPPNDVTVVKERTSLVIRVRVPRIVSDVGYWPPTNEAVQKVKALFDAGKKVSFDDIEGPNLLDAWRFKRD